MRIIRPDYIPSDKLSFLDRYGDPCKKQNDGGGPEIIEYLGTSNEDELKILYEKRFQIQSPSDLKKISQKIEIEGNIIL